MLDVSVSFTDLAAGAETHAFSVRLLCKALCHGLRVAPWYTARGPYTRGFTVRTSENTWVILEII